MTRNSIYLLSVSASHYRKLIYKLLSSQLGCIFILGQNGSSVKKLNADEFPNSNTVANNYIFGHCYYQKKVLDMTKDAKIIINDLGIMSITAWQLLLLSKFRKQKIYHWDHGWYGREGFVKKWFKRLYFGLADGAFIYGNYARNLMIENGFDGSKLYVIHNSLDYDAQMVLRNQMQRTNVFREHFGNDYPVLVMIGRLNLRKSLNMLIEATALLKEKSKFFNVILIGDGEDRKKLVSLASDLKISSQVWFYGACYDEKKNAELIYNADVCVVPGDIGLTAMHAMMFGTPCISHDYYPNQGPEFEAIQPGLTGSFFKHNDVYSLADCIDKWFAISQGRREDVRQACYKEVDEKWNPHNQIEIFKKIILS